MDNKYKRHYDIRAIPTIYRGITFRSRLEAKWAVFFDALNWDWIYEHQYFKLSSGNYLPDFYFPDFNAYAEAKPNDLTSLERLKCAELSENLTDIPVILLVGIPTFKTLKLMANGGIWLDVVLMPKWSKYYPFFYTDLFDTEYFDETVDAVLKSVDYEF